jgi:hypothetical protein
MCRVQHWGSLPWRSMSQHDLAAKSCPAHNVVIESRILKLCHRKSDFKTMSQKWSPYWSDMSRAIFGSLLWRSRSQHDLAAKSCPAHNFVIWCRILKLFHRNDHHIKTTCCVHHLGRYIEDQGHSMTFEQKSCPAHFFVIWSQILKLFHRNDHHIGTMCRAQHVGGYIEGQGHSMTFEQNRVRPITS